jgi:hypothetical protein
MMLIVGSKSGRESLGRSTNPPATGHNFHSIDGHSLGAVIGKAIP